MTQHFRTEEFACHDGTPAPRHSHADLRHLCSRFLEPLRKAYGPVSIVSGYRTPAYNTQVGGAPNSFHIYRGARPGVAADVVCQRGKPADWARFLHLQGAGGLGRYPTHIHVDNRAGHARW